MKNKNVLFVILVMILIISIYNSFSKKNSLTEGYGIGFVRSNSIRTSTSLEKAMNLGAYNLFGLGEGTNSEPYYYYPYEQYPLVLDQQF